MWNRLPIDDRIVGMGFQMPSRCSCCSFNSQSENVKHLLFEGDWARYNWNWFINIFHLGQIRDRSWEQWLELAFLFRPKESFVENLQRLMRAVMLWEIWKERCSVWYGNKLGKLKNISWRVMAWVREFSILLRKYKCKNDKEVLILRGLKIYNVEMQIQRNLVVCWGKSPPGYFKLNVDGAAKGNPGRASGGGIIRDHNGSVLAGFSNFYGHTSNMVAEFNAVRDGLLLCSDLALGLSTVIIEFDSRTLVDMFNNGCCSLWQL